MTKRRGMAIPRRSRMLHTNKVHISNSWIRHLPAANALSSRLSCPFRDMGGFELTALRVQPINILLCDQTLHCFITVALSAPQPGCTSPFPSPECAGPSLFP